MHVVAYLPRLLLAHIRIVLGDTHSLVIATDPAELHALLGVGDADLLILDPSLHDGRVAEAIETIIERHAPLPVVVYTTLTPEQQKVFDTESLRFGPRGGHRQHGGHHGSADAGSLSMTRS